MNISSLISFFVFLIFLHLSSTAFMTTKIGPKPLWNATSTDKLRQDLLLNYDKFARPSQHTNVTTVKFEVDVKHVEVNEFKSTMTLFVWAKMHWNDDKLKWNESDYDGIDSLNIAAHEIWQPDLSIYNSAGSVGIAQYSTHCVVESSGTVFWVPSTQFTVLCSFNLLYWPFDKQNCSVLIGSWTYHGNHVDITVDKDHSVMSNLHVNSTEWVITSLKYFREAVYYPCCEEPYPTITLTVLLQRLSPSYKALIITPSFVIIVLTLLSFWLPPQSGEKILLNGVTALIITAFMMYFTQKIPAMGTHTPLIVLFYTSSLYVICFSLINSVVVIWMSRTPHAKPVPWFIKNLLLGKFGNWIGLSNYVNQNSVNIQRVTAEEMRDHQVTDFDDQSDDKHFIRASSPVNHQQDWIMLAVAIDRLSFIFYSLLFAILAITYSI
ncbi:neuronal acetylcholine receptor subunit alpha-3-like [Onthophagus taurus]|uniref:neuronal acetylcholine receptor subunit alpha-3-like n=1 Tax=Onthophagus taurus TaxID=166361 RepID=UPI0039BE9A6B